MTIKLNSDQINIIKLGLSHVNRNLNLQHSSLRKCNMSVDDKKIIKEYLESQIELTMEAYSFFNSALKIANENSFIIIGNLQSADTNYIQLKS